MRVAMLSGPDGPGWPDAWQRAAATVADVVELAVVGSLSALPLPGLPFAGRDPRWPRRYEIEAAHRERSRPAAGSTGQRSTAGRVEAVLRFAGAEGGAIDVLHAHTPGAVGQLPWLSKAAGIPYVLSEHDRRWLGHPSRPLPGLLDRRRAARLYREAAAVLPVSDALLARIGELGLPGRHLLVPHPVDADALPDVPARVRISQDPVRIVAAGPLVGNEGWDVLVDAFAEALDQDARLRLRIIGDGPGSGAVHEHIQRSGAGGAAVLAGGLGRAEILHALAHADLFADPRHVSGFGTTALDALCCGTPVVAARTGALPELVGGDGGILVPPSDPRALARALVEAAAELPLRQPWALAARTRRHFGPQAVGARLATVYTEASGRA
ncbi:glycosyltransferase [Streptomyces sp. SPB162]|uniref:glycosyltransferase family 4 protein n=1 Tax=Streptomyces sp. SPB162 TaxID=2940560 RepID=UPI0024065358|nr:glycosyltransferase [Streptomyces sp. SPB162]MDF9811850.1 teichuronic acid biosynthesis glycosyltransferase TuaC [Streptomyces sp. SPB162]